MIVKNLITLPLRPCEIDSQRVSFRVRQLRGKFWYSKADCQYGAFNMY